MNGMGEKDLPNFEKELDDLLIRYKVRRNDDVGKRKFSVTGKLMYTMKFYTLSARINPDGEEDKLIME